jgi:hypothetical protein
VLPVPPRSLADAEGDEPTFVRARTLFEFDDDFGAVEDDFLLVVDVAVGPCHHSVIDRIFGQLRLEGVQHLGVVEEERGVGGLGADYVAGAAGRLR